MRLNYKIIIAMLVLAVFAVGAVSAAENVTTDIENSADDLSIEETSIDDENIGQEETLVTTTYTVNSGMSSEEIDEVITNISTNLGGGTVNFEPGTYSGVNLNLKNNVALMGGEGVLLVGNSYNHVIEVANVENFTISGLTINANYLAGNGNVSAIHGSFATNGIISGNTLYNGYNGININKKYDNLTIENNNIYHITYDGISLANPQNNDIYPNIIGANIINNRIESPQYAIFVGGTFKGNISNNRIYYAQSGIQFLGKPNNSSGHLNANINGNYFLFVATGVELYNPDIIFLNITSNYVQTNSLNTAYTVKYNNNTHKSTNGYIGFFSNTLSGCILRSFIVNFTDDFDNILNGTIIEDMGSINQQVFNDILFSDDLLGVSFQETFTNSNEIITNYDFSDGLNGWENSDVSTSSSGHDGDCIVLNKLGSYISQSIDWTLIEKFGFFYKFDSNAMTSSLKIKIGETSFDDVTFYDNWNFVEIDTKSIEGIANLTLTSSYSIADFLTGPIYIDSIMYLLKSSPVENDDLIVNPNFTDELNGWNYEGIVFPLRYGENGSGVSLVKGMNTQATLSQNIDWSSIEKISFKYKSTKDVELTVNVGEVELLHELFSNPDTEWTLFEFDTRSIEGEDNLTFILNGPTGANLLIDSIEYELKPLINTSISIDSTEFGNVDISLKDVNGNPIADTNVTYKINGVEFTNATDSEGKIKLSNLLGLVTIDANFTGDKVYNSNFTSKIFDFKLNSTISITNESKVITITLTDEKGNAIEGATVNYTINDGETLSNVTLSNGQFIISDVPDEFEIKVQYGGNQTFNAAVDQTMKFNFTKPATSPDGNTSGNGNSGTSGTAAQTTKKATKLASKITAKKKTFKAKKKTKKYTITLKAGKKAIKKVKVTLKVGKKTYKATTNSKGKATFKITKLNKKGKYTAVIKFKGNKTYKASSKKVKITVKK